MTRKAKFSIPSLFSASAYTSRKIPSKDRDCLHVSKLKGVGGGASFVLILCIVTVWYINVDS